MGLQDGARVAAQPITLIGQFGIRGLPGTQASTATNLIGGGSGDTRVTTPGAGNLFSITWFHGVITAGVLTIEVFINGVAWNVGGDDATAGEGMIDLRPGVNPLVTAGRNLPAPNARLTAHWATAAILPAGSINLTFAVWGVFNRGALPG